jgi:hypothetical protein
MALRREQHLPAAISGVIVDQLNRVQGVVVRADSYECTQFTTAGIEPVAEH